MAFITYKLKKLTSTCPFYVLTNVLTSISERFGPKFEQTQASQTHDSRNRSNINDLLVLSETWLSKCEVLLLRRRQASQQTKFSRVHVQPGLPASEAKLIWDYFGCLYITAFASITSNRNWGSFNSEERNFLPSKWYRCGRENPVSCRKSRFSGRTVWKQIPMTKVRQHFML